MERNKLSPNIIIGGQKVVCTTEYIQEQAPRLTPTGKISHAKTRVYTQRYRKEWELMPDFKGWLTSVERQPTRAYCTYCKKNLHAHRLSLLKHTCTMKHQRAALMYQTHMQKTEEDDTKYSPSFESITFETVKQNDDEENENDNDNDEDNNDNEHEVEYSENIEEYIEEQSIDMDSEEQIDEKTQQIVELEDCDSQDFSLKIEKNEPCSKKIKLDPGERRDTLAEAMAHVHGECSDDNDNQYDEDDCENMENGEDNITEEEREINQVPITKILNNHQGGVVIKLRNKKSTDDLNSNNDTDDMETKVYTTCQLNSSHLLNTVPPEIRKLVTIVSKGTKTTLFPGKNLTFASSKLNTKLVLDKLKASNNLSLMVSDPKTLSQRSSVSKISNNNNTNINNNNNNNSTTNIKNNSKGSTVTAGPSEKTKKPSSLVRNIKFKPPPISTHVMDTSKGIPVSGLQVSLYKLMDGRWTFLNESSTLSDGRCTDLVDDSKVNLTAGRYKIHFDVDKYFTVRRIETMYPFIEIVFDVKNPTGNYHIPVLLSPHSYTTYRDSGGWPSWDDSH